MVRYLQLPNQPRPLSVTLPLRVLAIRSEPADYPRLDLEAEWSQVMAALSEFIDEGAITVTDLAAPTLSELRRVLLRERFHVLHYMGHGGFTAEDGGMLLFTDRAGRGMPVTGEQLSVMLRDHTSLRLAVLNACEAGRTDPADPFGGIADTLVRRGIPAVIAMQFEISDTAAIEFAPALYGALAVGRPVDAAVAEARKAIYAVSLLEWATPVLHLRAENAHLFDIADIQAEQIPAVDEESGYRDAIRRNPNMASAHANLGKFLIGQQRYPEAETTLREAIRLNPDLAWVHGNLGRALMARRQYLEAEVSCRGAIRLDPSYAWVHGNLGYVLIQLRHYSEAESTLREAIRLDPNYATAHADLGHALFRLERFPEAKENFRNSMHLDPNNPTTHNNPGVILGKLGRYEEAETEFQSALRLKPRI